MAYNARNHDVSSERMQNWFGAFQNLRVEAAAQDEIYTKETREGSDAAFANTTRASKREHMDGITLMRAFKDFVENGRPSQADRVANITPFTASRTP